MTSLRRSFDEEELRPATLPGTAAGTLVDHSDLVISVISLQRCMAISGDQQ
jgi:hypothetical protein